MPRHVVVDGSNLATEGRSMPSLKQLNEAVMAWIAENPTDLISVVVDATFGHRIDPREVSDFDAAVENNEIVAPPAGAIGRGDAFVLAIADKVKGIILSNDSYQEFHGQYEWLFDEGRLIGGKPVPHIGWVYVTRVPVRGPLSRKAVRESKRRGGERGGGDEGRAKKVSKEASLPMPVPKAPPPGAVLAEPKGRRGRGGSGRGEAPPAPPRGAAAPAPAPAPAPAVDAGGEHAGRGQHLNDLLSFLGFVEKHPVGTTLSAIVETYSSHGAYVKIGDVSGYVPLRLMADPAPRSARSLMSIGEAVTLVVAAFNAGRRGIDLGLPGMVPVVAPSTAAPGRKRPAKKAGADTTVPETVSPPAAPSAKPAKPARSPKKAATGTAPKAPRAPTAKRADKEKTASALEARAAAPVKKSAPSPAPKLALPAAKPVKAPAKPAPPAAKPVKAPAKPAPPAAKPVKAPVKPVKAVAPPVEAPAKPAKVLAKPVKAASKSVKAASGQPERPPATAAKVRAAKKAPAKRAPTAKATGPTGS